jgi:hypothetical protein
MARRPRYPRRTPSITCSTERAQPAPDGEEDTMPERDEHEAPLRGRDLHHEEGRGDALRDRERPEDELRGEDETEDLEDFTRDEFMNDLSLDEISTITGLPRPPDPSPEEERKYRQLAWENVKIDVESRDEWGGVVPDLDPDEPPPTEDEKRG